MTLQSNMHSKNRIQPCFRSCVQIKSNFYRFFDDSLELISLCFNLTRFSFNANSRDLILTHTSEFFWWLTILDDRTAWHLNENDYSMQIIGGLGQFIQTRVCLCKIHMPISHIQCNLVHEQKHIYNFAFPQLILWKIETGILNTS